MRTTTNEQRIEKMDDREKDSVREAGQLANIALAIAIVGGVMNVAVLLIRIFLL